MLEATPRDRFDLRKSSQPESTTGRDTQIIPIVQCDETSLQVTRHIDDNRWFYQKEFTEQTRTKSSTILYLSGIENHALQNGKMERDKHGRWTTSVKQKLTEMNDEQPYRGSQKRSGTKKPCSPQDNKWKPEKHQHGQLEPGGPEYHGCTRLPNSYTDWNAMGHYLLSKIPAKPTNWTVAHIL